MSEIDQDKLKELVESIKSQFIEPYKDVQSLREIKSTTSFKDSDPLTEIQKLSQIIKAHSTKIGIVCQPAKFFENYPVVFKELQNFTNSLFYLLSILPLIHNDKSDTWTSYLAKKLDSLVLNLLNGVSSLCQDIERMIEEGKGDDNDRLITIGSIWAACDSLDELAKKGNFQLLADSIRSSCDLVDDMVQDVDSWLEDPQFGDELLIDDDLSDEDDEEKEDDDAQALKAMEKFLIQWKTNLKMVKLLLSSFAKSLATNVYNSKSTKASMLDKLHTLQLLIVEQLDEFLSDVFMSDASFEPADFKDNITALNDSLGQMVKIIKNLNTSDPKKLKWITVWENKYFQDGNN
ncbi:uncharacterized protein TDEL_0G03890 [Torulaspora delbrueckii]|uniref:Uncharacterized protein n=1 Tax=Torulaspora delbrueckii TaxID=4950 RepID=G8ZXY9_TORDE|nr:hypothetical protein TDEL_0G03890 [Torulaspora delbrueckii]CCE93756.1 hypothetical protein TDEL_0G03890 [Torulaspora delbrueckii]